MRLLKVLRYVSLSVVATAAGAALMSALHLDEAGEYRFWGYFWTLLVLGQGPLLIGVAHRAVSRSRSILMKALERLSDRRRE